MPHDEASHKRVHLSSPTIIVIEETLSERKAFVETLASTPELRRVDEFLKHLVAQGHSHGPHSIGSAASGDRHASASIALSHAASSAGEHDAGGIVAATRVVHSFNGSATLPQ